MRHSKPLTVALSLLTALFILTVSIAVPILFRPFYYAHIGPLGLEDFTGLSRTQITDAYDDMMDFCTGRTEDFSVGLLPWSQAGKDHFVDVRGLFLLDLYVAGGSGLLLLSWVLLRKKIAMRPHPFWKKGFLFWGPAGLGAAMLTVGGLAALDFSRAFTLFHTLFFPGKSNWLFDPYADPIILLLPEVFFRNCAIFILLLMLLLCTLSVFWDLRKK